jgi:hypothetical protein
VHVNGGDPKAAARCLEDRATLQAHPRAELLRCKVALLCGDPATAERIVSAPSFPAKLYAYYTCAVRMARGQVEATLSFLDQRAYEPYSRYWAGIALRRSARYEEASAALAQEAKLNPVWLVTLQQALTAAAAGDAASTAAHVRALPQYAEILWRGAWIKPPDEGFTGVLHQLLETEHAPNGPDSFWLTASLLRHPALRVFTQGPR